MSELTRDHLEKIRVFYEAAPTTLSRNVRSYRKWLAHYYNLIIPPGASILEIGCGSGELLGRLRAKRKVGVDLSAKQIASARARVPDAEFHVQAGETLKLSEQFDCIIISETLNYSADVQLLLDRLHGVAHAQTRLIFNFYSNLWRPILTLASWLGLRAKQPQSNWLSMADMRNLLELSDWNLLTSSSRLLIPVNFLGLDQILNRWVAPLFGWFCLTGFCVARPARPRTPNDLSTSVIIPARNEAGNIEAAVLRTPDMGSSTELIFVEGHSSDNTWEEIQRVQRDHPERKIKIMQQTGRGKGDAVRMGYAAASGDILMILDADLTMPPEELPKFFEVLEKGKAEFANGCRLVYPMDEEAMQFLNLCANKTFGIIFTWLLGQPVKDTLCGTKVLSRAHYDQIAANRAYFGDFDPFGDFDLLFGAAKLNLKIADVPIRYKERTYGSTNIHRWSHGWLLLRMVLFAARKLKFV
ncbi:MAG: glycosyltransferase [Cephaloticoccus sp.]|nr:glycosyltransferase [Cephaloticoccus sp.]MCF7761939.1 glycosyltransferase [Cephaloticoccus sp.]